MREQLHKHASPAPAMPRPQPMFVQRACACGGTPGPDGECAACKANRLGVQRKATIQPTPSVVPPIVHEVLHTPGQPLDSATRTAMESRFGHDFSRVRVHADTRAAESARAVGARAYTVGNNIAFDAGRYEPGTVSGRQLIAHELAHVVQQDGASATLQAETIGVAVDSALEREAEAAAVAVERGDPVSIRSTGVQQLARADEYDPPIGGGGEFGGGGASASFDDEPATYQGGGGTSGGGGASSRFDAGPDIERDTRVEQVVISCSDRLIIFETLSRTLVYRLETCHIPIGSYNTTVTVDGNHVEWDFGEQAEGEVFYFTYTIREGQDNPATLFESGQNVPIQVVPSWTVRRRSEQPACLVSMPRRVVIPGDRIERELFPRWEREITVWEQEIPLAEFGWADLSLVLNGTAEGDLSAGYGPGVLHDVCLVRRLDNNHLAGTASFDLPADFTAELRLNGTARLAADYLSVIPVAAIEGAIEAVGTAHANNRLNARVDVIYDHVNNEWRFVTEASVAGEALLSFTLDTRVAVEVLSRTIWSERWNLVDETVGFDWNGGIRIGRDLALSLNLGRIARSGTAAAVNTSAQSSGGGGSGNGSAAGGSNTFIPDLAAAILAHGSGQQTVSQARRGLSRDDALPFHWHKPIDFYPVEMELPLATPPITVGRDDGPTRIGYEERGRTIYERIGVARRNWPFVHKTFQYIPEDRSDTEKDRFRRLVRRLGYSETGVQIDHVHDVQFGGRDRFDNLWPMSEDANMSAGPRHQRQLDNYRQTLGNIHGRWFEIVQISL